MKITKVTPLMLDRYLLVQIDTDAGISGIGESGAWGFLEASEAAIEKFGRYLVGEDPLRIEHHWQYMYRFSHFRGSAVMGALSAIDIALWDIMGKHFDTPVHQLLGGKVRDRARVYYHVFGDTTERLVRGIAEAKEMGFTAVGHLTPFLDEERDVPYFKTHAEKIRDAIETVRRYRETVGNSVDLCIEIHRRLTPAEAVQLGLGIEEFHPYFYEDPITPGQLRRDGLRRRQDKHPHRNRRTLHLPVGIRDGTLPMRSPIRAPRRMSSRRHNRSQEDRRIGRSKTRRCRPHNPLSPVSTAACLQIAATAPNFALQEYPIGEDVPPKSDMVDNTPQHDGNGYLMISDRPGIGIDLKPDAVEKCPPTPREVETRLHFDGSVIDQ